jgi:hypothetical protein
MKKVLALSLLVLSGTACATDLSLSTGRDSVYKGTDVTTLTAGTSYSGFSVAASYSAVVNKYKAGALTVGKDFAVGPISVGPRVGVELLATKAGQDAKIVTGGIAAGYALSKSVSVVADVTRRFDLKQAEAFKGTVTTVGLKTTF